MSLLDRAKLEEHKPSISEKDILKFAALAWSFPWTSHKVMDPVLANAFAKVIDIIVNGGYNTVDSFMQDTRQHREHEETQTQGG